MESPWFNSKPGDRISLALPQSLQANSWTVPLIRQLFLPMAQQPLVGRGLLIIEASISHSDISHSAGLLWTSDQPDAENFT
jgi:hypothetical protein